MAELKTKATKGSVSSFLKSVDVERRADCEKLVTLMRDATGAEPRMWGSSIVGFGDYHYAYASGRSGEWFQMGFSPRKTDLTLYVLPGIEEYQPHLAKLGKHRVGRSCLYIKRLGDIDMAVLQELISEAGKRTRPGTSS